MNAGTYRRNNAFLSRLWTAAVVVGLSAGAARGATIYTTGFEAPTYTSGLPLLGQDAWLGSGATIVSNGGFAQTGTQFAVLGGGGATAFRTTAVGGSQTVDVTANLNFIGFSGNFLFSFNGGGGLAGSVAIDPNAGTFTYSNGIGQLAPGPINAFTYNRYDLVGNFATNTYSFAFNGTTLASNIPFANLGGGNFLSAGFTAIGAGGVALDNYAVNTSGGGATPEPGSMALVGLGLAGLGWRARRRARMTS